VTKISEVFLDHLLERCFFGEGLAYCSARDSIKKSPYSPTEMTTCLTVREECFLQKKNPQKS